MSLHIPDEVYRQWPWWKRLGYDLETKEGIYGSIVAIIVFIIILSLVGNG